MKRIVLAGILCISASAATADALTDNPAFCFGFLSAQSAPAALALRPQEHIVRALFASTGPKDSTDERDFEDWRRIGRNAAADQVDHLYVSRLEACRQLFKQQVE